MKIQLPNGQKRILDENISLESKKEIVDELIEEFGHFIIGNWKSDSIKFFLDNLGNYLVWHKEDEDKNKEDKDVLSVRKIEQMEGKRKANSTPFSSLSKRNKDKLFGEDGGIE